MVSPLGSANLLTSPSDDKWRAIRKAIAVSFNYANVKQKFHIICSKVDTMIGKLHGMGSARAVDVDEVALRITLDVIGLVRGTAAVQQLCSSSSWLLPMKLHYLCQSVFRAWHFHQIADRSK
jgi:cytochrome P450